MSALSVSLSRQPAPEQWGEKALLSFENNSVTIHLPDNDELNLRFIRKAARKLEGIASLKITLQGDWHIEQQWAFATSFSSPKNQAAIHWSDNQDAIQLDAQFSASEFVRRLINASPEEICPQTLANEVSQWLTDIGGDSVSVKQTVGEQLQHAGWVGIYEVGRGSNRPPVLLEVDYNPEQNEDAPVCAALVGKGITFDSGGYSIKSSEGMLTMKCDMGGAATVAGALGLAMKLGLKKRVKLFLCCAENLISGHAYKLGDILTYKNGTSVEIVNTDAEGRLVLADGLLAAGETGAPLIIDAATLTGAALVAVGTDYNALFSLDKPLQQKVVGISEQEQEPAWPLPLELWHQEHCPSAFADTANSRSQKGGGFGGASNAAGFLSRFVPNQGQGWLHFDLAAVYHGSSTPLYGPGASSSGVRTIAQTLLQLA